MNLNGVRGIVTGSMVEALLFCCNAKFEEFHLNHGYFCPGTVQWFFLVALHVITLSGADEYCLSLLHFTMYAGKFEISSLTFNTRACKARAQTC